MSGLLSYPNFVLGYMLFQQVGGGASWKTLVHNGVMFPPEYKPHQIPLIVGGNKIVLNPIAEEYATLYAKYLDTDYVKNPTFNKNFWKDWSKLVKDPKITSLEVCDFSLIKKHIDKNKEQLKELSKEEKEKQKKQRDETEKIFKTVLVDGKEQPIGNYRMEPPGIFLGRGNNPKTGKIKPRLYPEDITLNLGKEAPVPKTITGHTWGKIIHDRNVEWLASWDDPIIGKKKYVWLGAHSELRGANDMEKFDKARKLKRKIKSIRDVNDKNLASSDMKMRQIATALYFIDYLALRVGNEKGSDEADTVGVTSLRVEHIELLGSNNIKLDFLGKDSVRYVSTVRVEPAIYQNLELFVKGKNKGDELFDKINSNDLNKYLQSFMKELTAKVFRTFKASSVFQHELRKISTKYENYDGLDKQNIMVDEYNKANLKIASSLNHQKKVSKSFKEQVDKIGSLIKKLHKRVSEIEQSNRSGKTERIEQLRKKIKLLKNKKQLKKDLKNLSLGTSKTNYIDPRISVAFIKKHKLNVDKFFTKTLQEKFKWAFETDENFVF